MKHFIVIFLIFSSAILNAQSIHTFYIDSTHITGNWQPAPSPKPTDTSFTINSGDNLYFINKLASSSFNIWINDPDLTMSPTYSATASFNDTILKIEVLNDTTYSVNGWTYIYLLTDIVILNGTADFGRRYFINHIVGIDDLEKNTSLFIYPSPANDVINIKGEIEKETVFTIYDLSGRSLKTGLLTSNNIEVSEFPKGAYLLHLSTDNIQKIEKFIKN
ncbi:MAG: T9SS type A sorting domain-containing protein [Flavobacteriales bacterium]|nr:T9SS type A sorting domain-containing protein [Flavobacteriales bacterium]